MANHAADLRTTRSAYDTVAADYARLLPDLTAETPLDRAALAAFSEMVRAGGTPDPLVAEVGCGTGRVTRHLTDLGLRMLGLDLSPGMVATAREGSPGIPFLAAHAAALPLAPGCLGGLLSWYSLIHLPADALPKVFVEFARVAAPGAPVMVAFQCGDGQRVERTTSYEQPVPLTYYRHRVEGVSQALEAAGFVPYARVQRSAALVFESTPQAILIAHRR